MDEFNNAPTTEEVVELENTEIVETPPKPKKMTAWKVVNITLVSIFIGVLLFAFVNYFVLPIKDGGLGMAIGIVLFLGVTIYGLIGVVAIAVPCIIATVKAFKKSNNCTKGTKALFLILTLLPLVFDLAMLVMSLVYTTIKGGK